MSKSLLQLLEESVSNNPDALAVVSSGCRTSYTELWDIMNDVASLLLSQGVKQQDRVALLMENSAEYIASYYGVLAAGATVVALNTATKVRDLANWLVHSEAKWLIADAGHPELKHIANRNDLKLNTIIFGDKVIEGSAFRDIYKWSDLLGNKKYISSPDIDMNHLASIIYTSGTTGKPKGVMLSHNNLYVNTQSILSYLGLSKSDSIMNVLPFYYSYGNSVLHSHLAVGGKLILENSLAFPRTIIKQMAEQKVTGFSGVPSTYALLMNRAGLGEYDLSSLRYMTQAGGAMAPANIERLRKLLPHVKFFVMYGQTEATARLAYLPPDMLHRKPGSIGIAIPGVILDIRDDNGNLLPANKTGEIWAKGDNIMLGYWKDPDMTAKVLCNGWLRTGDLAHKDEEGYLYIDGRSSDIIKSGAHRISPKEIEEVIAELENISEVAVLGMPDELLGQVIKATIVPNKGTTIDKNTILAHCRKNLPMYKIPKLIEFRDVLPKTASGKIKRYLLQ